MEDANTTTACRALLIWREDWKKKIEDCAVKIKSSIREKYTVVIVDVCALKQIFPILYYSLYLVYIQRDFIPVQLACMCVFVYVCVFY